MSDSKQIQGIEINKIVNNRNKWLFSGIEISRYLVNRNNSLLIPSGNMRYSSLKVYPSYIYNLLKLAYYLVKQLFSDKTSFQTKSAHILFSTGEGHDLKNYNKLLLDKNVEVIHLEAFNTSQKINFNIVELKLAFSLFLENFREANSIFRLKLPLELRKKIVNFSLPQLAIYTYLCAFLSVIKEQIPNVKIFHSGAELLSMAATRAELETVCLYHGLADKTSTASYPCYDHIYVYASEEKSYFEDISPNSNVYLYPVKELPKLEKRVIIFQRRTDSAVSEETLSELLTLFLEKEYKIFLKKHPTYTESLADKIVSKYNLEVISTKQDASEAILNLRPSFTVGWSSTALCESLSYGVIPISLEEAKTRIMHIDHIWGIYPLRKRSFSWVEEQERIIELLEDTSLYVKALSELRTR
tara:strand:+ start:84 stop:1325 length:1242 start_codon:yes stop_codon:yes gene_type:complete